jgi:DNA-binding response OmpR family regulator
MARVLVIDDDLNLRKTLGLILATDGHEVELAENGLVGTRLQRANPFDLVLTDLHMPEKEGIETIMELRKDFPDIKIIAISGAGKTGPDDETLGFAKKLGADEVLQKPIENQVFKACVRDLLKESHSDSSD